ncbi:kanadaptin [Drosophila tropicalis]|uniref:kanadaptin n=1 Tax=Drosophila tropicalis TaxID=46794 RepID=UPI0035ABA837
MDEFKVPAPLPKLKPVVVEKPKNDAELTITKISLPVSCPYKVPKWSQPNLPDAEHNYKFEVLKSGQIIDEVKLRNQAVWTFGRLPENDVAAAHPTISRYHAVLQYKPKTTTDEPLEGDAKPTQPEGWYIYDLGSTHGTFLNKQRVPSKVFIRMRVGHMLKLGGSTRAYILQGPSEDEEPESELSVTELREQREQQAAASIAEKTRQAVEAEERERNEGVSWGMGDDADEETDLTHNPYASTNNEDLFFDDPKRTLRGFFEREGLHLEYKCDELSQGSFVCRVELPIDDSNGRPIVVEVTHKGRKKDCVVQCALDACRTLDRHGVLRQANQESQKRKLVKAGDSDDEDEFWDRTGDVARKKQRKANAATCETLTYDDLLKQECELHLEMEKINMEIAAYQLREKRQKELTLKQQRASDDLDNFMDTLTEDVEQVDKTEIKKLRLDLQRIKVEQLKIERLIKIAKPTALPYSSTIAKETIPSTQEESTAKKQLPMIGKRNQFSKFIVVKATPSTQVTSHLKAFASDEEEIEQEEEEGEEEKTAKLEIKPDATPPTSTNKNEQSLESSNTNESQLEIPPITKEVSAELVTGNENTPTQTESIQLSTPAETKAFQESKTSKVIAESVEDAVSQKKTRPRHRERNKPRLDVDMDINELAQHEDSEKYAKWVPPADQSGDGITHLNEKFGY